MWGMDDVKKNVSTAAGVKEPVVPEFTKKSKAKYLALSEAAKGQPTIATTIMQAAYLRVKNNSAKMEGSKYSSHADLIKTYALNQAY